MALDCHTRAVCSTEAKLETTLTLRHSPEVTLDIIPDPFELSRFRSLNFGSGP
jgi:hypothetical protein